MRPVAPSENRRWLVAGAVALSAHGLAAIALSLAGRGETPDTPPEPVVLVELPPLAAPAAVRAPSAPAAQSSPRVPQPATPQPPVKAPDIAAPLPREVVSLPPPAPRLAPQPVRSAAPMRLAPPVSAPETARQAPAAGQGSSEARGQDPAAQREQADYFAMVSAHLNRRKQYPREARRARQQGVVTVRFTVHRDGRVTGAAIRNSSGFELLDQATLDLLVRVSPLPEFPASMARDSVTLALPIDYSLRTN